MTLTEDELKDLIKQQREHSKLVMDECIEDAWEIVKEKDIAKWIDIATALFDKRSLTLYSLIQAKLDEKIKKAREEFEQEKKKLLNEKIRDDHDS